MTQNQDDRPIDDTIALRLQALIRAGDRDRMADLYAECKHIATVLAKSICARNNHKVSQENLDDVAHDVATTLTERMLKEPGYYVRSFRSLLYLDTLHRLTDGESRGEPSQRKLTMSMEDVGKDVPAPEEVGKEDTRDYLHDIISEHGLGVRVIRDLAHAPTYKKAILEIVKYTGELWIRDRAVKLQHVYRILAIQRN